MSEPFNEYRWGELLEIIKTPVEMKDDDVFPLASIRRRNGGFFHRETKLGREILTKTLCKAVPGTFAISRMQVVHGACSYVSESFSDSFLSASYTQFQAKSPPLIDTKYLHYFSHTSDSYIAFLMSSHGVHIEKMTFDLKDWLKRKVKIPPLPEQKKIASILTSVDEVIENTQKKINKLQDLKKATMNELLTKGIGHTEFKDSELGRIPKSWEVLTFSESNIKVLDGDRGNEYPKEADFKNSGFCLFLSAKNVTKNGFRFDTTAFITKDKDERLRKGRLNPQDIVITTRGTVGNIAFYDDSVNFNTVRINSGMAIIRNNNAHIECTFIYKILSSGVITTQLKNLTFGSAQPQLTIGTLNELRLPIPPFAEQSQIVSAITSIQIALDKMENKLYQTKSLKKSLMQDLLTGKVRVTVS